MKGRGMVEASSSVAIDAVPHYCYPAIDGDGDVVAVNAEKGVAPTEILEELPRGLWKPHKPIIDVALSRSANDVAAVAVPVCPNCGGLATDGERYGCRHGALLNAARSSA